MKNSKITKLKIVNVKCKHKKKLKKKNANI